MSTSGNPESPITIGASRGPPTVLAEPGILVVIPPDDEDSMSSLSGTPGMYIDGIRGTGTPEGIEVGINVKPEIISVNVLEKEFSFLGKNSSTKPTISGKKTGIRRIFISNLEILQLKFGPADFLLNPCRFLTRKFQ